MVGDDAPSLVYGWIMHTEFSQLGFACQPH